MISFSCPNCGAQFEVEDELSGARVACSDCGTRFYVPAVRAAATLAVDAHSLVEPRAEHVRLSPRQRRLATDFRLMQEQFSAFPLIHLEQASGNPPERYVVSFHIRGIERVVGGQVVYRDCHAVEIRLPGTYPRTPPTCRMLTPIFHPNIEPAIICVGDHWTAAERLCDLVVRIGEMIAYQAYNIKSPLDGEAAMWADLNQSLLPIDGRDLQPPNS